jgi:hypothetical protein
LVVVLELLVDCLDVFDGAGAFAAEQVGEGERDELWGEEEGGL